jgi:cell division protein FtsW
MINYKYIFWLIVGLCVFGLIMVGSSSVIDASRNFGDKWYYLKLQSIWSLLGVTSLIFFSHFNHLKIKQFATPILIVNLLLLVLVLIPGIGNTVLGARRWINLGPLTLQPSELIKLSLAIFFSSLLSQKDNFIQFVIILLFTCFLVMLQPDLGTTMVIAGSAILTYYGSGGQISRLLAILVLGLVGVVLMIFIAPYRLNRLKSYINTSHDPLGASYQIRQALIALGSGGLVGQGLGQSKQKYTFLPETTTDSIFAVTGEEFGFLGTATILGAYTYLVIYGYKIASKVKNKFSSTLAVALTSIIGLQAFINISAITAIIPLTGIPLTFISYGGSSLVIMLVAAGMLINIDKTYV